MSAAAAPDRSDDRLESWKAIAEYLDKSQSCVRRWEREEGLPVHRQEHLKRPSIVAYKSEIDAWRAARTTPLPEIEGEDLEAEPPATVIEPAPSRRRIWPAAALAAIAMCALLLAATSRPRWIESGIIPLTAELGSEGFVSFAPGAESFAYVVDSKTVSVAGRTQPARTLWAKQSRSACCVRWSPRGDWIAIPSRSPKSGYEIELVDPAGNPRPGSPIPGGPEVTWRPDGSAFLYTQRPGGAPSTAFEYTLATGKSAPVFQPEPGSWGDVGLGVSPDGLSLAVIRYPVAGNGDIYVHQFGKTGLRRLTWMNTWINGVDWLPDNRTIVFAGSNKLKGGLFHVDSISLREPELIERGEGAYRFPRVGVLADGSYFVGFQEDRWNAGLSLVLPNDQPIPFARSTQGEEYPAISESGEVVFYSARAGGPNLFVCASSCLVPRQITFSNEQFVEMTPRWSPDGTKIAFVSRLNGKPSIWVVDATGANLRAISTGYDEGSPAWSANGRQIYFRSDRSGRSEIWRIPVTGGDAERITDGGGFEAFESADGRSIYYARSYEDARIFRRDLTSKSESEFSAVPPQRIHMWMLSGETITYFAPAPDHSDGIKALDLRTGVTKTIVANGIRTPLGLGSNRAGAVVYASRSKLESDIRALHFRRRPFWQLFAKP